MKIRMGFVSNSSSSSWSICMWGTCIEIDKYLTARTLACGQIITEEDRECGDIVNMVSRNNLGVEVNGYEEYVYIGIPILNCPDNQTMGDFKREVEQKIEKFMGAPQKCKLMNECFE